MHEFRPSRVARLIILLAFATSASAQQVSRHEVAIGIQAATDTPNGGTPSVGNATRGAFLSPQLRYTFNINRSVALESSISSSTDSGAQNIHEGGYETLILGGLKAGVRRQRFGLFGTFAAGAISDSAAQSLAPSGAPFNSRITHFALQQGVALELYSSPRTFIRFDIDELLEAQFDQTYILATYPYFYAKSYGVVANHAAAAISIAHRFGHLSSLDAEPAPAHPPRYSIGGLYVTEIREHLLYQDLHASGGGGAWIGLPLYRFLSLDLLAYDQPQDDRTANVQDGGSSFAAFAGPKLGFHVGSFGLFAKARPGIMRFSRTNLSQTFIISPRSADLIVVDRPKIDFALDTGLVLEYSPPTRALHHALLRFEGGSTYIHYHGANLTVSDVTTGLNPTPPTTATYYSPPQRHSSITFLTGIGYRF